MKIYVVTVEKGIVTDVCIEDNQDAELGRSGSCPDQAFYTLRAHSIAQAARLGIGQFAEEWELLKAKIDTAIKQERGDT